MGSRMSIKVENPDKFKLGDEVEVKIKAKVDGIENRPDYGDEIPVSPEDEPKEYPFLELKYADSDVKLKPSENEFAQMADDFENEARGDE